MFFRQKNQYFLCVLEENLCFFQKPQLTLHTAAAVRTIIHAITDGLQAPLRTAGESECVYDAQMINIYF